MTLATCICGRPIYEEDQGDYCDGCDNHPSNCGCPVVAATGVELDEFLNTTPPDYDWLVPGLIERRDRTIVTAGEGHGKSTWLRQMGVQFASGIHPFGGEDFKPLRVLLFDLENSERQVHRKIRPLRAKAGDRYAGGMIVRIRPEGLDFGQGDGELLEAEVAAAEPDVLIIGPLYRLADEDSDNPARAAKVAMVWLDKMRVTYDCALFIEAHSPHGEGGKKRPTRPYGSSQWLRWPEFGIHLAENGTITHWRGARDERDWPAAVQRGGEWPWSPVTRPRDLLWSQIMNYCTEAGDRLSLRDLAKLTGSSYGSVSRAVAEHQADWDALGGDG